jgi:hypothetical protein
MIGLFGQEAAFAAGAAWHARAEIAAAMPDSCADMMQKQPAKAPCKGMTLDCIAAMGCVVPLLAVEAPRIEASPLAPAPIIASAIFHRLVGRSPPPEPEPPTPLI